MRRRTQIAIRLLAVCGAVLALLAIPGAAWSQRGQEVTINQIRQTANRDRQACEIQTYVTVADEAGQPIPGLTAADFKVLDFSRGEVAEEPKIEATAVVEGMAIVLAMDTSGSMTPADKIGMARSAAEAFLLRIAQLQGKPEEDRVALYSFADRFRLETDWKTALTEVIQPFIRGLEATPDASTCLFDTAYAALQKAAESPGRGAVVLFTDGVDEKRVEGVPDDQWPPCSAKTLEDVVELSRDVGKPIYTIGLRARPSKVEQQRRDLNKLADLTGGRFWIAPEAKDLTGIFETIANQLKKQYVIRYEISKSATADRTVRVQASVKGELLEGRMNYRPCDPGPQVSIANLQEGQRFRGGIVVQAGIRSLNGVRVVQYEVDGQAVGEDTTQPFEQSVTFTDSVETPHTICVRAVDQLDVEDRVCINVIWEPGPTVTPSPTPGPVVVTITAPDKGSGIVDIGFDVTPPDRVARIQWLVDNTVQGEGAWPELKKVRWDTKGLAPGQYTIGVKVLDARGNELGRQQKEFTIPSPPGGPDIGLLIIAALVLAAGLMGVLLVRRRRRARPEFVEEEVVYGGQDAMGTADIADGIMTKDVSDEAAALGPIARLRIKRSLELSSTETFDLYARSSRIGRGSDNDIPIPDAPVSRQHAELRYEDDRFRIYDLNSTYGTRVNGTRVPPEGADLKDGDEVQLGTRTVLVFEQIVKPEPSKGDETKDIGGGEETRDIGGGEETRDIGDTAGTQPFHP